MTTSEIRNEEGSARAHRLQFQIISAAVWVTTFILIWVTRKYWHQQGTNPRILLPLFHVLPWVGGLIEMKRVKNTAATTGDCETGYSLAHEAILRLLGSSYIVLIMVEFALL